MISKCEFCNKEYKKIRINQKFCSLKCRYKNQNKKIFEPINFEPKPELKFIDPNSCEIGETKKLQSIYSDKTLFKRVKPTTYENIQYFRYILDGKPSLIRHISYSVLEKVHFDYYIEKGSIETFVLVEE